MKEFFAYTVEAILRVLDSEPMGRNMYDIAQFLWGGLCVVSLIVFFGMLYYKAAACMKKFAAKRKKHR